MDWHIKTFKAGDRVQLHPATDWWMRGARYGDVLKVGRKYLTVRLDHGRTIKLSPRNVADWS